MNLKIPLLFLYNQFKMVRAKKVLHLQSKLYLLADSCLL